MELKVKNRAIFAVVVLMFSVFGNAFGAVNADFNSETCCVVVEDESSCCTSQETENDCCISEVPSDYAPSNDVQMETKQIATFSFIIANSEQCNFQLTEIAIEELPFFFSSYHYKLTGREILLQKDMLVV